MDLEMTCWDEQPPRGMWPDIIQVNTETLNVGRQAVHYVRPRHSTISAYCTALTGITQEIIQRQGRPFQEVMATIARKFGFRSKACFTWGDDEAAIESACTVTNVASPFNLIDLSFLFRLEIGARSAISLPDGLRIMRQEFQGVQHDALTDARNTARLHIAMLRQRRIIRLPD